MEIDIKKLEELECWQDVKCKMNQEGFHYCFKHYSNWEEIKDEKFHQLRTEYLNISNQIEEYVNEKIKNIEENI
jgi:hypothetical protein